MVSLLNRLLVPAASTMANISGRMIRYSPVSSKMMRTAVMGALAAPANTVPIPTSPYAPAGPVDPGKRWCTRMPNAVPSMAPMNSDGANTPPEPPIEMVRLVATTFPMRRITRNHTT